MARLDELLAKWSTPEACLEARETFQDWRGQKFLAESRWQAIAAGKPFASAGEKPPDPGWIAEARQQAREFARRAEESRRKLIALQFETDELRSLLPEELREMLPPINWFGETTPNVEEIRQAIQAIRRLRT